MIHQSLNKTVVDKTLNLKVTVLDKIVLLIRFKA